MTVIIGISLSALILAVFVRDYNKTASIMIMIAAAAMIFFRLASGLSEIFSSISAISSGVETAASYIKLMIKVLGIVLITQFVADLCRDCGENALASQTETAAKVIVIAMILPLFETVIKIITGLLE
ncbi:MAG: stage III sporulation AC/AD family protein [Eubacterium sp.]|jgi:stage III sporulation protein AD|nr:stage III sporulation AC/AD family protein [Eubacterium sp.]